MSTFSVPRWCLPALLLWSFAAGASAQVVKCTDPSGRITYQQGECATSSTAATVVPAKRSAPESSNPALVDLKKCEDGPPDKYGDCSLKELARAQRAWREQDQQHDDRMRGIERTNRANAASQGIVVVGQSKFQVEQAWGPAASIDKSQTTSGQYEAWHYIRNGKPAVVFFANGNVVRLDERGSR